MAPGRRPTVRRNPPVNRSTNQNNVDINSGIDTQMLDQLFAIRVAEALAAAAVTHAASTQEETNLGSNSSQNKACNYKEFRAVMHENFRGTEGAVGLTRWFEKLESPFGISNVAEGDRVKFASSTLLDGALIWWNVYVSSVTLDTAHATPWCDFNAMFIRKYCPRNEVKQIVDDTTLTHALLLVTTVERQDIRPKTGALQIVPQTKEDQEATGGTWGVCHLFQLLAKRTITRTSVQPDNRKSAEEKSEIPERTIEDVLLSRDFPELFPEDFPVRNSTTQEEIIQEDSETQGSAPITTAGVFVSTAEPSTPPTTTTTTLIEDEDLTIAQTLMKIKSEKSKAKGVTMQRPSESGTRVRVPPP
ncbi:hypothetical protein Tco_1079049 [Tanacetum coccineum]|uniref:Reverse transcriptase domain-containing protein n=1 Tax=Tanacetum coccineum TaxID=301880 RepID=A0ABQ5HQW1_9ASTR